MKKTLLLFAMLLGVVGAWAQRTMPTISDEPQNGEWAENTTWYNLKTYNGYYYETDLGLDTESKPATANIAGNHKLQWCITGNDTDGYKLYNRYQGPNEFLGVNNITSGTQNCEFTSATEGKIINFKFRESTKGDSYWCLQLVGSTAEAYLARNGSGGHLIAWATGYNTAKGDGGAPISFELAEDLPEISLTNVQPNGDQLTLYIDATNQTLTFSMDSPKELGAKAKFAYVLHDEKYTFYNEASKSFLVWRNDNTSNKGTMSSYNAKYCDWSLTQSQQNGVTYFRMNSKRNGTNDDGTLILLTSVGKKEYRFDGYGNTVGWTTNTNGNQYSNLFTILINCSLYNEASSSTFQLTHSTPDIGVKPIINVEGVELSEGVFDGGCEYSANIKFPIPVSSETKINPTMISSFSGNNYKWYATEAGALENGVAKKVSVIGTKKSQEPTDANRMTYMWAIYPTLINNAFTYKVKNLATGTYVHSTSSTNSHAPGAVTLQSEGSELTYVIDNKNNRKQFKLSTDKYLSLNSTSVDYVQYVGTWGSHGGCGLSLTQVEDVNFELHSFAVKSVVEGYESSNPNTHLGAISVINGIYGNPWNLSTSTISNVEKKDLYVDLTQNISLAHTRNYRGYKFLGFWLGETELGQTPTLKTEQVNAISETNPIIAKYEVIPGEVTLFYDDDAFSYRIPAIAKTSTGRLIAVSDYRHNLDDIGRDNHGTGTMRIDLVARTSDDNGKTWSPIKTIAEGTNDCAYGDAAIAVIGEEVIVMAAGGSVMFNTGSNGRTNKLYRIYSPDNGDTWKTEETPNITDVTANVYGSQNSLFPDVYTSFFGSGKLAVDPNFNNTNKARIYGAMLTQGKGNRVIFSDDKGLTWKELGTAGQNAPASQNEPKVEILPSGQILLSVRRDGGRTFNVFTYGEEADDKTNGSGSWAAAVNGCNNDGNSCNGEIYRLEVKKSNGDPATLLLQSQPKGSDRENVTIWYKEISNSTYTPSTIAADWTKGLQVSTQKSAYSAMAEQADGKIAFFFEEAPCYGDDHTKGYSMVYVPLTLEKITGGKYADKNAQAKTVTVIVTDTLDNTYNESLNIFVSDEETIKNLVKSTWAFASFGEEPTVVTDGTSITYTNTVTLPFKVSNGENTYWHNIYFPANTQEQFYPVYLSASATDDEFVPKVTESQHYGVSSYNTKDNASKINWAIYSVNNGLTFKFKNELTGKFIQATSVASGNEQNVKYVEEANATAFEIIPDVATYKGDYALKASINNSVGYLCSTSVGYANATHYSGNGHQGAWVKFVEAPDFDWHIEAVNRELSAIGTAVGLYATDDDAEAARTAMTSANTVKWNTLKGYYENIRRDGREVNSPATGKFYRIKNNNTGSYIHGNTNGTITLGSNENYPTIFYLNENNQLISYRAGRSIDGNGMNLAAVGTIYDCEFNVAYGNVIENVITIKNNGAWIGHMIYQPGLNNSADGADNNGYNWKFEVVEWLPVPVNTTVGYATLYSPVALNTFAPNTQNHRVEAYIGTIKGDRFSMEQVDAKDGIIPANTPVILVYKQGAENGLVYLQVVNSDKQAPENELSGTFESSYIEDEAYVLSAPDGVESIGLYKADLNFYNVDGVWTKDAENGTHFLNNGFKAYLPAPAGADARFFLFDFGGEETGITETENGNVETEVYDLSGRRVLNAKKGIFVINGKVVVK